MKFDALIRRRLYRAMLNNVRRRWAESNRELADVECLSDTQRASMSAILRRREVQSAAESVTPWGIAAIVIIAILMTALLLGVPFVATGLIAGYAPHSASAPITLWLAYIYMFLTAIQAFSRSGREGLPPFRIQLAFAALLGLFLFLLLTFVSIFRHTSPGISCPSLTNCTPLRNIAIGLLAAAVLAIVAAAVFNAAVSVLAHVLGRAATRPIRIMVPNQTLAAHLIDLLIVLAKRKNAWRDHRSLRQVTQWTGKLIDLLESDPDWFLNAAGLSRSAREEIALRGRQAAQAIRDYEARLLSIGRSSDYDLLIKDIGSAALQTASEWVPGQDPSPQRQRRMLAIAKRIVPAAILTISAVALPKLPGISVEQTTITSIQVGLFLSAAFTLIPAQPDHLDRILSAYKDATR